MKTFSFVSPSVSPSRVLKVGNGALLAASLDLAIQLGVSLTKTVPIFAGGHAPLGIGHMLLALQRNNSGLHRSWFHSRSVPLGFSQKANSRKSLLYRNHPGTAGLCTRAYGVGSCFVRLRKQHRTQLEVINNFSCALAGFTSSLSVEQAR